MFQVSMGVFGGNFVLRRSPLLCNLCNTNVVEVRFHKTKEFSLFDQLISDSEAEHLWPQFKFRIV